MRHVIRSHGVMTDPKKIKAMTSWLKTTNVKELMDFLSLIKYYCCLIAGYGIIARSLTEMLKKNAFQWNQAIYTSFHRVKEALTKSLVLALLHFSIPFIMECDASNVSIDTILMQNKWLITHISSSLKGKNLSFSTYEKKLMVLVLVVKKWCSYLFERYFIDQIDHHSLKYLWEKKKKPLEHNKNGLLSF